MTKMGLGVTHVVAGGISWVQIPALPSSSSMTLGKTPCLCELQFHLLEMGLMCLAHKRPAVCVSHWSSCPRWCWDPGFLLPPSALPMVPWGLGPSPVGPVRLLGQGRAPSAPLRPQGGLPRHPSSPDAYLVFAIPAHDQVIVVAASRMLGGQAEAAVLRQGERQRVGELHWRRGHREGQEHELRTSARGREGTGGHFGATRSGNLHKIQKLHPHLVPIPLSTVPQCPCENPKSPLLQRGFVPPPSGGGICFPGP